MTEVIGKITGESVWTKILLEYGKKVGVKHLPKGKSSTYITYGYDYEDFDEFNFDDIEYDGTDFLD